MYGHSGGFCSNPAFDSGDQEAHSSPLVHHKQHESHQAPMAMRIWLVSLTLVTEAAERSESRTLTAVDSGLEC